MPVRAGAAVLYMARHNRVQACWVAAELEGLVHNSAANMEDVYRSQVFKQLHRIARAAGLPQHAQVHFHNYAHIETWG